MQFGSHVYGTNTPESDQDFKGIYIPDAKDILLQRVRETYQNITKKDKDVKNTKDDVDVEIFSLGQYMKLLLEGQTGALDMMFTPRKHWILDESSGLVVWEEILENKDKFLHSGVASFVGYCKTQANKYGIKGSRMGAVEDTLEFIKSHVTDFNIRMRDAFDVDFLKEFAEGREHVNMVPSVNTGTQQCVYFFEVIGKKFELGVKVKQVVDRLEKIYDEYGERAKLAKKNQGIDWKALMHAVRVKGQAVELLTTGQFTFPRPDKELLLKIRKGELDYSEVAAIIEDGLIEVQEAQEKSILPAEPDRDFADQLIVDAYAACVSQYVDKEYY
ncbi:MAG: nucleotidyltransferase domain-containing protein [Flavobacteriaceae bacterium]|nr:nucleotidyltransferase domain-containing protein [Flavobacteriaceae bacterium]